jgi:chaperonin GroES
VATNANAFNPEKDLLPKKLQYLADWIVSQNIAETLDQTVLDEIGQKVIRGYDVDKDSRSDWEKSMESAMKVARQVKEAKSFPWPDAANVKYPLITTASIQFAARAYPELIQGHETVRCQVIGEDLEGLKDQKANRVSKHMSWQLMEEMEEWEDDSDRLLHVLPVMGMCFKKTYYSAVKRRIVSELILPEDIVIHYKTKSLETARRITQEYEYFKNDVYERIEQGLWLDVLDDLPAPTYAEEYANDEDAPYYFLEQHRWLDLDEDGYEEPYTVTVHKETSKVVRIVARYDADGVYTRGNKIIRIVPIQYFTKFGFIPDPGGSFYDLGFGLLLNPLNEAANTVINQLLDAGTLANLGGGFLARGVKIKSGTMTFKPGEWKPVDTAAMDLKQGIVPLPHNEPSRVLFELLGLLIEAAKDISSVKDVLTGEQPGQNVPATTVMALIEQGLKVFSAIYKRIFRGFAKEFKKIFTLNSMYLDDQTYFRVLDVPHAVSREDYDVDSVDVRPTADPTISSDAQRLAKANALMVFKGDPSINQDEINYRYMEAIRVPSIEKLIVPPEQREPQTDPKIVVAQMTMQVEQAKLEMEKQRLELEAAKMEIEMVKAEGEVARWEAQAIELRTRAESYVARDEKEAMAQQFEQMRMQFEAQMQEMKSQVEMMKEQLRAETAERIALINAKSKVDAAQISAEANTDSAIIQAETQRHTAQVQAETAKQKVSTGRAGE